MVQANEKHDKIHNRLLKELNRLKTDLNNEADIDTDLTKRQLRSRMLVASTPRVPNLVKWLQWIPLNLIPISPRQNKTHLHPGLILLRIKVLTRTLKIVGLELQKSNKTNKKMKPLLNPLKLISTNWKLEKSISQAEKWKAVFQNPKESG